MNSKKNFFIYRNNEKVATVESFLKVLNFIFEDFVKTDGKSEYSFRENDICLIECKNYDIYKLTKSQEGFKKEFYLQKSFGEPNCVFNYIRCAMPYFCFYFTDGIEDYYYHPFSKSFFCSIDEFINFDRIVNNG